MQIVFGKYVENDYRGVYLVSRLVILILLPYMNPEKLLELKIPLVRIATFFKKPQMTEEINSVGVSIERFYQSENSLKGREICCGRHI